MPRKTFVSGQVLTDSDLNDFLMDQSVMTYSSSAARSSAIPSPTEGMVTYLEDNGSGSPTIDYYDGSNWKNIGSAVSTIPSSVTINATQIVNTVVTESGTTRTITSSDAGKVIQFTSASPITVTVDASTDFANGERVDLIQDGAGTVTIQASGTAVVYGRGLTAGTYTIESQYDGATLLCLGTDSYRIIGNVRAV